MRSALATGCAAAGTESGEYKPITLRNGLRALVCSDRAADRAAAALDVHVGSGAVQAMVSVSLRRAIPGGPNSSLHHWQ